jgi:hypothetical protein
LTSPTSVVAAAKPTTSKPQGAHHRRLQLRRWPLPGLPTAPLGGHPSTSPTPVVAAARPTDSTPRGPTIDVFNSSGGRCRTCRQQPPGGLPSMSPTPVVATAEPADSNPQWGHHRCLQLQWWPLPDLPTAPPMGPAIDVSNFGGGCCRTCRQHPPRARHRRLQLQWWPLSDLPLAPPGGPPSMSPTSVVAAKEPAASNPQGAC